MVIDLREKLIRRLEEDVRSVEKINYLSVCIYQSLNVHPMVYSCVIPVSELLPEHAGFINAVFYKNPHITCLFVSKVCFFSEEKARRLAKTLLLSSGKYIFDKRFVLSRS